MKIAAVVVLGAMWTMASAGCDDPSAPAFSDDCPKIGDTPCTCPDGRTSIRRCALDSILQCECPAASCVVDGSYTVTGSVQSGNCSSGGSVTDTFTTLPDGRVKLEIRELPGVVVIGTMNGCQWIASTQVTISDATGPENLSSFFYSYGFTTAGFDGQLAAHIPPATSIPRGCTGTTRVLGVRQ